MVAQKFESIAPKEGFEFRSYQQNANALGALSYQKFKDGQFADLAYVEPLYFKRLLFPAKKIICRHIKRINHYN
jgi:hypothetical protein